MTKFNLLATLIFAGLALGLISMGAGVTRRIQSGVMAALSPFIRSSAATERQLSQLGEPQPDLPSLKRRIVELEMELDRHRILSQKYVQVLGENNQLREMVNFRRMSPLKLTAARVLKRVSSTWWSSMIIDKGALDGLATDTPVLNAQGLIGKTGKMAPHMAEVILLTDEMCRVSARIEGTLEKGILAGERAGVDIKPDLRLSFLSRSAIIPPGSPVLTTGEGGIFPPGVMIGRVKRFEIKDVSAEAVIEPAVDFSQLDHVFVLEQTLEAPGTPQTATSPQPPTPPAPKALPVDLSEIQTQPKPPATGEGPAR